METTKRDSLNISKVGTSLGLGCILLAMGLSPLEDSQGMGVVIIMLHSSLDKDRYQSILQFESVRKFCSTFSNV